MNLDSISSCKTGFRILKKKMVDPLTDSTVCGQLKINAEDLKLAESALKGKIDTKELLRVTDSLRSLGVWFLRNCQNRTEGKNLFILFQLITTHLLIKHDEQTELEKK